MLSRDVIVSTCHSLTKACQAPTAADHAINHCDSIGSMWFYRAVPSSLAAFRSLTALYLMHAPLATLHDVACAASTAPSLREVVLHDIDASLFPPECCGMMSHLTKLGIFSSRLGPLPDTVGELAHLTELQLVACDVAFRALPDQFAKLTALRSLSMECMPGLESIRAIEELPRLQSVKLWRCERLMLNMGLARLLDRPGVVFEVEMKTLCVHVTNSDRYEEARLLAQLDDIRQYAATRRELERMSRTTSYMGCLPRDIFNIVMTMANSHETVHRPSAAKRAANVALVLASRKRRRARRAGIKSP